MKAIINGTRYDTSKAQKIGEFDNIGAGASSQGDFHFWEASLYRTPRSGKFFLVGYGGPMTQFGAHGGWGQKFIPMSRDEAFDWAQRYLDTDVVEEYFSDMVEDA